jgi:hypothetical protein
MEENKQKNRTKEIIQTDRTHKDKLFRFIFGKEENKKYLLELYNAINHSDYENPEDLKLTTLEDVLYISMKNDVSFLLDYYILLYEHQSTLNPNMPIRGLFYMSQLYHMWVVEQKANVYGSRLVKIPTPQYVVFYNGEKDVPDKMYLHLSDAYQKPITDGEYEWTAIMYNINADRNPELMKSCKALREYASFIYMVRENYQETGNLNQAIEQALNTAISENYMDGFFECYRSEVYMNVLTDFDVKIYEDGLKEDGREEGKTVGKKGRN